MKEVIETEVLVIGAGPAGAAASVFLGQHGVRTVMVSRYSGTADTPRAHITNQRAMEALRDAGLEEACMRRASPSEHIQNTFWLRSMAGEELARVYSWGNDPRRLSDYATASPCRMSDLPQTELEPILVDGAIAHGVDMRFSTELVSFEQDETGVTAHLADRTSGQTLEVRAKYMIGADGARSGIVEQLGIPLEGQHGLGCAINVHCDIDLTPYVQHRHGSLFSTIQPGSSLWAPVAMFRMVKPWTQWLVALMVPPTVDAPDPSVEEIETRLRELVGVPDIAIKILSVSKWWVNDVVAQYYSDGRIYCMGDAVHRHPPTNGLGSNTCVQDAFNLAWKLAYVLKGWAAPSLLDTYNEERQPVGRQIVARANQSMGQNHQIWDLLGAGMVSAPADGDHLEVFDTPQGRAALRAAVNQSHYEYHAHGVEMNRAYVSSAVVPDGSDLVYERDPELFYQPSGRPGACLPHVWLGQRHPSPKLSTLDVAGKQRFTLLIGPGGEAWRKAAAQVAQRTGVYIEVAGIGPFLDYEDLYGRWGETAGVDEGGCVLVRPDLYIAWRSASMQDDPTTALHGVMNTLLGLGPTHEHTPAAKVAQETAAV